MISSYTLQACWKKYYWSRMHSTK